VASEAQGQDLRPRLQEALCEVPEVPSTKEEVTPWQAQEARLESEAQDQDLSLRLPQAFLEVPEAPERQAKPSLERPTPGSRDVEEVQALVHAVNVEGGGHRAASGR